MKARLSRAIAKLEQETQGPDIDQHLRDTGYIECARGWIKPTDMLTGEEGFAYARAWRWVAGGTAEASDYALIEELEAEARRRVFERFG